MAPLPDVLDLFAVIGAGLMLYGGEHFAPGAGYLLAGAAFYFVGLRGPKPAVLTQSEGIEAK